MGPVTCLDRPELASARFKAHNRFMTITYPNGTVLKAIVLSHENNEIRAITAGCDDVLVFTYVQVIWTSEDLVPVTLKFEWQQSGEVPTPSEDDCVCPKELAIRLIQKLFGGDQAEAVPICSIFPMSPSIRRPELRPN
jgi:hypothetical protein